MQNFSKILNRSTCSSLSLLALVLATTGCSEDGNKGISRQTNPYDYANRRAQGIGAMTPAEIAASQAYEQNMAYKQGMTSQMQGSLNQISSTTNGFNNTYGGVPPNATTNPQGVATYPNYRGGDNTGSLLMGGGMLLLGAAPLIKSGAQEAKTGVQSIFDNDSSGAAAPRPPAGGTGPTTSPAPTTAPGNAPASPRPPSLRTGLATNTAAPTNAPAPAAAPAAVAATQPAGNQAAAPVTSVLVTEPAAKVAAATQPSGPEAAVKVVAATQPSGSLSDVGVGASASPVKLVHEEVASNTKVESQVLNCSSIKPSDDEIRAFMKALKEAPPIPKAL